MGDTMYCIECGKKLASHRSDAKFCFDCKRKHKKKKAKEYAEKHREEYKVYLRERYHWLKEHGLCVSCGRVPARAGRVRCAECEEGRKKRPAE